ncbi:MAG TPA: hypothetical protein VNY73_00910 [Bacteroidia bacterium]|nr:hypothetical protein [Bacteroidia bacterium]
MSSLLKNTVLLLAKPVFTLLFLCVTLIVFLFHTRNYNFIVDDYYLLAITLKRSFTESMQYLYMQVNGRWFSNALAAAVFGNLGCRPYLYWYVQLTQFFLFLLSVSFFFRSVFKITTRQSLHTGAFFTCLFYWFCFDARVEVWYWEASCLVHLVCLVCIFFLYGIILREQMAGTLKIPAVIIFSLFIGGLSETFALACILISLYQVVRNRKEKNDFLLLHVLVVVFISISLAVDYFCPGTDIRIHNQPIAEIGPGLKNTIYSFYLQLTKFKYLPFKAVALFLLWPLALLIRKQAGINGFSGFGITKIDFLLIVVLILQNTFIPAHLTSFETADRIFVFNWILILLLLLNYLLKRSNNIISS